MNKLVSIDMISIMMILLKTENLEIKDYTCKFLGILLFKSDTFVQ